jgi:hypothetical protein
LLVHLPGAILDSRFKLLGEFGLDEKAIHDDKQIGTPFILKAKAEVILLSLSLSLTALNRQLI